MNTVSYTIGGYLRISQEDTARDESNSITNQRAIIQSYIASKGEYSGAKYIDYTDDGISGSRSDRDSYQRLLNDVRLGVVDCIIVKDLSRIGRNLIDVDDLLMNYLVLWGVRFVAINDGYDSYTHSLSKLELAIINLANQHYNRDLAVKSMSAKFVKMKRGEYLSCHRLDTKNAIRKRINLWLMKKRQIMYGLSFPLPWRGAGQWKSHKSSTHREYRRPRFIK